MAELNEESIDVDEIKQLHDRIMDVICVVCQVSIDDIKSKKRNRNIVDSRVLYSHFLRKYTNYNKSRIGILIMRDHATVIHYLKNHERYLETDFEYKVVYNQCEALIKEKLDLYDFSNQITYIESLNKEIEFLKEKCLEYKDKYSILNFKYNKLCNIINN